MEKLSQRQLLEAFGDIVRGITAATKVAAKTAAGAAAKSLFPKTTQAVQSLAQGVKPVASAFSDAIPSRALAKYLKSDQGRRLFKLSLDAPLDRYTKEKILSNGDHEIQFQPLYIDPTSLQSKPITATAVLRRQDNKWHVTKIYNTNTNQSLTDIPIPTNNNQNNNQKKKKKKKKNRGRTRQP